MIMFVAPMRPGLSVVFLGTSNVAKLCKPLQQLKLEKPVLRTRRQAGILLQR